MVFYEAPRRVPAMLADVGQCFGWERQVVLARELTKTFETFYYGSAEDVLAQLEGDPNAGKGEFVVIVAGAPPEERGETLLDVDRLLSLLLPELPVKQVAKIVAELTGSSKNELYQRALALRNE